MLIQGSKIIKYFKKVADEGGREKGTFEGGKPLKTILSLFIYVLVLSVGLTACNHEGDTTTGKTTGMVGTVEPGPFGKYDPPITITFGRSGTVGQTFREGESYENNIYINEYKSELGIIVKTDWITYSAEDYATKLNLSIASDSLPDLFKIQSQAQLQRLTDIDMIQDLSAVYRDYASPFVKEVMSRDDGFAHEQCTIDEKLMAYPTGPLKTEEIQYFYLRDDLRKEIGKDEPKTFEDLVDIARTLVASGRVKYGFGFCRNPYETSMSTLGIFNAFGAYPGEWFEKEGKLVYGSVQPEMKPALQAMSQLYREGLVDKEFIVKDATTAAEDVIDGDVAVVVGQFWMVGWPLADAWEYNKKVDWRPYPILFSQNTTSHKIAGRETAISTTNTTYCIKKGYPYPEVVAKLHNFFMEKSYGATSDEKKYRVDGDVDIFGYAVVFGGLSFNNLEIAKKVTQAIDNKDESVLSTSEERAKYEKVKGWIDKTATDASNMNEHKFYYGPESLFAIEQNYIDRDMLLPDAFFGSETPTMIRRKALLDNNEVEMVTSIISGVKPIDAFDAFVEQWHNLGGTKITEEVNQWRDSWGK